MREFFTSRLFAVMMIIIIICVGAALYTGAVEDATSPTSVVAGAIITPVQNAVTSIQNGISGFFDYFTEYDRIVAENEQLKAEIAALEQKVRDAEVAIDENNRLRQLLEIKEKNRSFQFEVAEVVSRSTTDWGNTLSIDKGTLAGIEINDCVITEEGMVGYVTDLGPNYAEVTTIIDTSMSAAVLVSRSREVAVAEGDFELMQDGNLKMSYIKKDADVVIGDTLETSGNGGIFPKGLLVGTVERILPEDHGISNYAIIEPIIEIDDVKKVFVIKDFDITD